MGEKTTEKTLTSKERLRKPALRTKYSLGDPLLVQHLQHSDRYKESGRQWACTTHGGHLAVASMVGPLRGLLGALWGRQLPCLVFQISHHTLGSMIFYYEFRLSQEKHPKTKTFTMFSMIIQVYSRVFLQNLS